jgi:23S rRNA (adenine2030-N6)-methyltransferase
MNYRHAFHAGNFADVMKHALFARILAYLQRKEAPIRVIDTHAGVGLYDLRSEEAARTREAEAGIGRLDAPLAPEAEALLRPYRTVLEAVRGRFGGSAYPGSPAILREMLRPQDRGILVELHPEDGAALAARYHAAANLKVLQRDGWTALSALIPPRERRGLVLIDPPYEEPGEIERLGRKLAGAVRKWPTGLYAAWYPIKDLAGPEAMVRRLAAESPRPGLRLELLVDDPQVPDRLNGSGLIVVNPPWPLQGEAEILLPSLAERLARSDYGGFRCEAFGPIS